jgi:gamma-glutamyltranspeptidase/glutathione hydrolase
MNVQDAVNRPRFHHQWMPDRLVMEEAFSPDTVAALRAKGHEVQLVSSMCEMAAIVVENGWLAGAADPRTEGTARGY